MAIHLTDLRAQLEQGLTLPASWYSDPAVLRARAGADLPALLAVRRRGGGRCRAAASSSPAGPATSRSSCCATATGACAPSSTSAAIAATRSQRAAAGARRCNAPTTPGPTGSTARCARLRAPIASRASTPATSVSCRCSSTPGGRSCSSTRTRRRRRSPRRSASCRASCASVGSIRRSSSSAGARASGSIEANWKLVVENYLECYHCPVAHKSFSRLIDVDPDAYVLATGRWSSSQFGPGQRAGGVGERARSSVRARRADPLEPVPLRVAELDAQHASRARRTCACSCSSRIGPERTRTYVDGFWAPGTPDEVIAEITEFGAVVGQEDVDLVESVHRGLRCGAVEQGRLLLGSERLLQHFQLLVHDALVDAPPDHASPIGRCHDEALRGTPSTGRSSVRQGDDRADAGSCRRGRSQALRGARRAGGHARATPPMASEATAEARTSFSMFPSSLPSGVRLLCVSAAARDMRLMKVAPRRCQSPRRTSSSTTSTAR